MKAFFVAVLLLVCLTVNAKTTVAMEVKVSDDGYVLVYIEDSDLCEPKSDSSEDACAPVKLRNEFVCEEKWEQVDNAFVCSSGTVEHRLTIVDQ